MKAIIAKNVSDRVHLSLIYPFYTNHFQGLITPADTRLRITSVAFKRDEFSVSKKEPMSRTNELWFPYTVAIATAIHVDFRPSHDDRPSLWGTSSLKRLKKIYGMNFKIKLGK